MIPSRVLIPALATLALSLTAASACAQVIFGSRVNGPNGPVTGLFQATNGTVTGIATGLPANDFPSLSPDARTVVISSPDPQQPSEASWDLFAFDRLTGNTRRLVNNVTQPQPDGSFLFASPLFSGVSANGQAVAFVNQLSSSNNSQQGGSIRSLSVIRASDGFLLSTAEIGNGNITDFYQSEFVGISWSPLAHVFATPAYVNVVSNAGRPTIAAGIVLYGQTAPGGQFVRIAQLTTPRVFDFPGQIVVETHAYPAFSPDGTRLAYVRIIYPDVLMMQPASIELTVTSASGQGPTTILAAFNPGIFPLGLAWSADGGDLVFSIANQAMSGGQFPPLAEPSSAVLRTIDSVTGGQLGTVPGAPVGYFPNVVSGMIFRSGFE